MVDGKLRIAALAKMWMGLTFVILGVHGRLHTRFKGNGCLGKSTLDTQDSVSDGAADSKVNGNKHGSITRLFGLINSSVHWHWM